MKVNLEMQWLCVPRNTLRGIPYYMINIVKALTKRRLNSYSLSFFDHRSQRNNRKYLYDYIGEETLRNVHLCECNSTSYAMFMPNCEEGWRKVNSSYNDLTGANADVFHFPSFCPLPLSLCGKMVVTIHDMLPLFPNAQQLLGYMSVDYRSGIKVLEKDKSSIIITDSRSTKDDLLNLTNIISEQVFVVPLAHDESIHFPEVDYEQLHSMGVHGPYLCYLGTLDYRKGISDILEAFTAVKSRFPELLLVLAGAFQAIEYEKIIAEHKYSNDILCPGFVSDEQKRVLLSSATVFLFPSEYEGFGLPVLEAMACGSPVITTDVSSLPEVGGDAVVYVSPNNPEQLAYEIDRLLDSEKLRNEYIQKGFEQSSKFSWDKTAQMTEDVYKIAYEQRL